MNSSPLSTDRYLARCRWPWLRASRRDGAAALQARLWAGLLGLCLAAALAACNARTPAPPTVYTLLDGQQTSLAALRGQVVLVHFWATTCAVCLQEMPQMVATQRLFQPRGLHTVAIAMQHDAPARVADFAHSRRLPFDVVIDNTGTLARGFGDVQATPTMFVLDKRGAIVQRIQGLPDVAALHALVERLLAEV